MRAMYGLLSPLLPSNTPLVVGSVWPLRPEAAGYVAGTDPRIQEPASHSSQKVVSPSRGSGINKYGVWARVILVTHTHKYTST